MPYIKAGAATMAGAWFIHWPVWPVQPTTFVGPYARFQRVEKYNSLLLWSCGNICVWITLRLLVFFHCCPLNVCLTHFSFHCSQHRGFCTAIFYIYKSVLYIAVHYTADW